MMASLHSPSLKASDPTIAVSIGSFSCFLSILGSLLIITTYAYYPSIRKPARNLLFWLSVTDLGTAISYGLTFIECGGECECAEDLRELFTLLGIFFPVSSFLWTDCIGLYIYAATYQKTWIAPRERLFFLFHLLCWGLPTLTILTIIILKTLQLNEPIEFTGSATGGWCWIQNWKYDLLGGKVVEISSYVFLMVIYLLTWKELKRINYQKSANNSFYKSIKHTQQHKITASGSMLKDSRARDMRKQLRNKSESVNRLLFIPVVFFCLRIWGTIHMFLDQLVTKDEIQDSIDKIIGFIQAFCDPLQGFCNGILFVVFVGEVRYHLFVSLERCLGYKWLNLCGLICCCHYCFSCCCDACFECFECCLARNEFSVNNVRYGGEYNYDESGDGDQYDYHASNYQFLPVVNEHEKTQNGVKLHLKESYSLDESPRISMQ